MSSASSISATDGRTHSVSKMNTKESINMSIYAKRKRTNLIGLFLSMSAMTLGLTFLLWILSVLFCQPVKVGYLF